MRPGWHFGVPPAAVGVVNFWLPFCRISLLFEDTQPAQNLVRPGLFHDFDVVLTIDFSIRGRSLEGLCFADMELYSGRRQLRYNFETTGVWR
jgi:hypothetical protein